MRRRLRFPLVFATLSFVFLVVSGFISLSAPAQATIRPGTTPPDQRMRQTDAVLSARRPKAQAKRADSTPQVALPQFSVPAGSYSGTQTVSITDSTPGATIYCSTNGTVPVTSYPPGIIGTLTPCPANITVSSSEVLVAVATATNYAESGYASAQYNIASSNIPYVYSIAGNDTLGYSGDGGSALLAQFGQPQGVAVDSAGNVYVADFGDNVVRKITAGTGIISTFAGTGTYGDTGDGGPATSAELWEPSSIVIDSADNLYIAENGDNVVRKVEASTGVISTYAGNPNGTGGTNSTATNISFGYIGALALDSSGNLYIGAVYYVWKVDAATGNASQVVTNPAIYFGSIGGLAFDKQNNLYVAASDSDVVYKISSQGTLTTFAGVTAGIGQWGDGTPATSAYLSSPSGLAFDSAGNLYIADEFDFAIREVNTGGIINTVAGAFQNPYTISGDGSPATSVGLTYPQYIALDGTGNIYLADLGHNGVRKITAAAPPPTQTAAAPAFSVASGTYSGPQNLTITSTTPGAKIYVAFNGSQVTTASEGYHGLVDVSGSVTVQAATVGPGYLPSTTATATYTITTPPSALISTIAGIGRTGFSGSGGLATSAQLDQPQDVAFDASGNLYIADSDNNVVWKVASGTQIAAVFAGNGTYGFTGDNGPATAAQLYAPRGLAFDKAGNLYIADTNNNRIRMVAAGTGIITTIAGPGQYGTLGDGGPANSALLNFPISLRIDSSDNLYISDTGDNRIRKINLSTDIITTVAGGGTYGILDGTAATDIYIAPRGLAIDSRGNLYFCDSFNQRIVKVSAADGTIVSVAGNGDYTISGDGGVATQASIETVWGIAIDSPGNIVFSNSPATVRRIDAKTGIITTLAGNGYRGYGESTLPPPHRHSNLQSSPRYLYRCTNSQHYRHDTRRNNLLHNRWQHSVDWLFGVQQAAHAYLKWDSSGDRGNYQLHRKRRSQRELHHYHAHANHPAHSLRESLLYIQRSHLHRYCLLHLRLTQRHSRISRWNYSIRHRHVERRLGNLHHILAYRRLALHHRRLLRRHSLHRSHKHRAQRNYR